MARARDNLTISALALVSAVGCGSKGAAPAGSYPAFEPDIAQIANHGGAILSAAKLVTVTWSADPNEAALETFDDELGASSYWRTTVGEYGVGPATSGSANHVRIGTAPPSTMVDTDFEAFVTQQVTGSPTSGWPAHDPQTLYVLYVPAMTLITSDGADLCATRGSLHDDVPVGNSPHVPFVVVDEHCSNGDVSSITTDASHEIAEAVTNPHSLSDTAVVGFDPAHLAWSLLAGNDEEIGDVCETYADASFMGPADLPYSLQRLWSNTSAAAGHSPCAPQSSEPYYNVTPLSLEMLSVTVGAATTPQAALGYEVPVGSTKTFEVGYYSDAPTRGWDIQAVEGGGMHPVSGTPRLTLSVAKGRGQNGDKDTISVTVNGAGAPGSGNAILLTIVSSAPGHTTHTMPILIGAY